MEIDDHFSPRADMFGACLQRQVPIEIPLQRQFQARSKAVFLCRGGHQHQLSTKSLTPVTQLGLAANPLGDAFGLRSAKKAPRGC